MVPVLQAQPPTFSHVSRSRFLNTRMLFREQNLPDTAQSPCLRQTVTKTWSGCMNWRCWPRAWYFRSPKHGEHWGTDGGSPVRSVACLCPSCCPTHLGCSGQPLGFGLRQNRSGLRCCPCSCLLCYAWSLCWQKGFIG